MRTKIETRTTERTDHESSSEETGLFHTQASIKGSKNQVARLQVGLSTKWATTCSEGVDNK